MIKNDDIYGHLSSEDNELFFCSEGAPTVGALGYAALDENSWAINPALPNIMGII